MKLEVDFDEVQAMLNRMKKVDGASIGEKFLYAIVARCDSVTKKNTPVREKNGGTLRNSWRIKKRGKKDGLMIDYYNIAEYAPYVEYGHRTRDHKKWVTGAFMLTKGIQAVKRSRTKIARSIVQKELKKGK